MTTLRRLHRETPTTGFNFGRELIIDLYECDAGILDDADALRAYVKEIIDLIKMVPYGPCVVEHFGHANPITSGYTVYQLIETSCISLHLSPHLRTAHINIFSCQEFDLMAALGFSEMRFGSKSSVYTVLSR